MSRYYLLYNINSFTQYFHPRGPTVHFPNAVVVYLWVRDQQDLTSDRVPLRASLREAAEVESFYPRPPHTT